MKLTDRIRKWLWDWLMEKDPDEMPHVKYTLERGGTFPMPATPGAAGRDITCTSVEVHKKRGQYVCHTGLRVEIPRGCFGLLTARSSVVKHGVRLADGVGVIDSDYRGEITMVFDYVGGGDVYKPGQRIGQLIILPAVQLPFVCVQELSETERGDGGYGSTGE